MLLIVFAGMIFWAKFFVGQEELSNSATELYSDSSQNSNEETETTAKLEEELEDIDLDNIDSDMDQLEQEAAGF